MAICPLFDQVRLSVLACLMLPAFEPRRGPGCLWRRCGTEGHKPADTCGLDPKRVRRMAGRFDQIDIGLVCWDRRKYSEAVACLVNTWEVHSDPRANSPAAASEFQLVDLAQEAPRRRPSLLLRASSSRWWHWSMEDLPSQREQDWLNRQANREGEAQSGRSWSAKRRDEVESGGARQG